MISQNDIGESELQMTVKSYEDDFIPIRFIKVSKRLYNHYRGQNLLSFYPNEQGEVINPMLFGYDVVIIFSWGDEIRHQVIVGESEQHEVRIRHEEKLKELEK